MKPTIFRIQIEKGHYPGETEFMTSGKTLKSREIGSVKVSGRRGKKDSMEIDSISHLLDIHLDRGVINEGASARVRFEQTRNHSFVLQIEDLTFARIRLLSQFLVQYEAQLVYGLTRYKEIVIKTREIRRGFS